MRRAIRGNERIQQELQELAPIRSAADRLVTQCCGVKVRKKLWMFVTAQVTNISTMMEGQEEEERRKDEVHRRKRRYETSVE